MNQPARFWDEGFSRDEYIYGCQPNSFIKDAIERWLPDSQDVLALGAGEGQNAVYLVRRGHAVTAVDYSAEGLQKTRDLAKEWNVDVETIQADVREWAPERQWDVVGVTFLHLHRTERERPYRLIRRVLRPGGRLVAEWFRPEQRTEGYTSGGPPDPDMMVTAEELREHFAGAGIEHIDVAEPCFDEGMHEGPGATIRVVWQRV